MLLGQFTVGWYNDYLDRDRDRAAGRRDKPIALGYVSTRDIKFVAIPSFIASILLGFAYGRSAGVVYHVAMASALLYDYRLKRTIFSIVCLLVSFGLLPVVVGLGGRPPYVPALWMIIASALLGGCVHFLNVIPDFKDDKKTGVKGFVHYFSYRHALLMGALLLVGSVTAVAAGIGDVLNVFSILTLGAMAIEIMIFLFHYVKRDLVSAFKVSKIMTLLTIIILLCGAPYMQR